MSMLFQLFEKADVAQMTRGMDVDSMMKAISSILQSANIKASPEEVKKVEKEVTNSFINFKNELSKFQEVLNNKEDRVTWAIRILKIAHLCTCFKSVQFHLKAYNINWIDRLQSFNFVKKLKARMDAQEYKSMIDEIYEAPLDVITRLRIGLYHFYSQDIAPVEDYVYHVQSINQLTTDLSKIENEYKNRFISTIPYDEDDFELIKWYDGKTKAWVNLNRAECKREADAMGHCGNSSGKFNDTILSFRSLLKIGDSYVWKPHLTFILEQDGYLGEMKGRANNKPSRGCHPYIIDLLKMDFVKGIRGGGYAPEHNFAINDLDDQMQEELLELKPELKNPLQSWVDGDPGSNERLQDYIWDAENTSVEIDDTFIRFDTETPIADIAPHTMDNYKKKILEALITESNANKYTAQIIYSLLYDIIDGKKIDDILVYIPRTKIRNYIVTILKNAFINGDVRTKKAIWNLGTKSLFKQRSFDFVSKIDSLVLALGEIADTIIRDTEQLNKFILPLVYRAAWNLADDIGNSFYYGGSRVYLDNKDFNIDNFDSVTYKAELDGSMIDEFDTPQQWMSYNFSSRQYMEFSDDISFLFDYNHWIQLIVTILQDDEISIPEDMMKYLEYDVYKQITGEDHYKDPRLKKK